MYLLNSVVYRVIQVSAVIFLKLRFIKYILIFAEFITFVHLIDEHTYIDPKLLPVRSLATVLRLFL